MPVKMTTSSNFESSLLKSMHDMIEHKLNQQFDAVKDELVERLELQRNEIVASAALRISSFVSMQDMTKELRISISEDVLK